MVKEKSGENHAPSKDLPQIQHVYDGESLALSLERLHATSRNTASEPSGQSLLMGEEFEGVVELPQNLWEALKTNLSGEFGELFVLIWLAQRKIPEGEVWGLRRGFKHGRAGPLWSLSVEPDAWGKFSFPTQLLLDVMAPPSYGWLPRNVREQLKPLFSAWIPGEGEGDEIVRLLLAFMKKHRGQPWWSLLSPEAIAVEVGDAIRLAADHAAMHIVVSPASEFKALPLLFEACRSGDFALFKWSTLRRLDAKRVEGELKGVEVVEVKTGAGRLSISQGYAPERLRRKAERAYEALGRRVDVSYRVVRVELEKLELPKRAHITIQSLLDL